ncbi:MAG TPA: hypothetical protein VFL93_01330 [Longimicrobiaceae bacterium]|nr:hypothetical protein [Longimicrobiaceae bacterium]
MTKEYEVEVVYRQRVIYRVQADDREEAEREAADRWLDGSPSDAAGHDWSELESVRAAEAPAPLRREQDAELVLRFLRERERLILRLGGDLYSPSANDAISAEQVASDLGWNRPGSGGSFVPDRVRATEALERLCRAHALVCFERRRARSGERGEIRLYCTPEYLDLLTSDLGGLERQAV